MTVEDLPRLLFGAIFLIVIIAAQFKRAARTAKRSAGTVGAPAPAPAPASQEQRIAAVRAELARRGLLPALEAAASTPVARPAPSAAAPAAPQAPRPPASRPAPQPPLAPRAPDTLGTVFRAPVEAPEPTRRMLAGVFASPGHARTAVILAEVLAPPVALR